MIIVPPAEETDVSITELAGRARVPAAWLAAGFVAPLLIVGAALAALGRPIPHTLSEEARQLEVRLGNHAAKGDPEVIVVGNSKTDTDIDPAAFAKELGVAKTATLPVYASNAATWYAVLENRVYARGFEPKVVVVYAAMRYMLDTSAGNAVNLQRLEAQMAAHEPVIDQKMFGGGTASPFWDSVRKRKTAVRTNVVDAFKYRMGGLFFGGKPGQDAYAAGEAALRPALEKEFGANADFLKTDRARVVPVAEQQTVDAQRQVTDPLETFLPDLVDLVNAHHGRIVVVRAPIPASSSQVDTVALDVERAVVTYLNERTAGWLDLSDYILPEDHFRDAVHMNERGRTLLTKRLAAELKDMGALEPDSTFAPARLPMPMPTLTRTGTPAPLDMSEVQRDKEGCGYLITTRPYVPIGDPVLAGIGVGPVSPLRILQDGAPLKPFGTRQEFAETCGGASVNFGNAMRFSATDSFDTPHNFTLSLSPDITMPTQKGEDIAWVYPGTTLHMTVDERWDAARGPLRAVVEARIQRSGTPDPTWRPPTIAINGGAAVPFEPVGPQARYYRAVLPEGAVGATTDLAIESANDWVIVERAWLGADTDRQWLFGDGTLPTPVRFFENQPVYSPDPPVAVAKAPAAAGGTVELALPQLEALGIDTVRERLGVGDCMPLRPVLDGKYVPVAYVRETSDWRAFDSPFTFAAGVMRFIGGGPAMPPRTYDIVPDTKRRCEAGWWMYPGEHLESRADAKHLGALRYGATRMVLSAVAFPAVSGKSVHVKLTVKGKPVLDEDLPLDSLVGPDGKQALKTWIFPEPLPARMSDIVSYWDLPKDVFLMINYVSLDEVEADLPAADLPKSEPPKSAPPK